jgi:hypothetical protein
MGSIPIFMSAKMGMDLFSRIENRFHIRFFDCEGNISTLKPVHAGKPRRILVHFQSMLKYMLF